MRTLTLSDLAELGEVPANFKRPKIEPIEGPKEPPSDREDVIQAILNVDIKFMRAHLVAHGKVTNMASDGQIALIIHTVRAKMPQATGAQISASKRYIGEM